jgi:hypothetical protein
MANLSAALSKNPKGAGGGQAAGSRGTGVTWSRAFHCGASAQDTRRPTPTASGEAHI